MEQKAQKPIERMHKLVVFLINVEECAFETGYVLGSEDGNLQG